LVGEGLKAMVASTSVQIVLMARAAPDMRFGVPRSTARFLRTSDVTLMTKTYQLQGRAAGDQGETSKDFALVGDGDNVEAYPVGAVLFGEEFISVRGLMQRFSLIDDINANNTTRAFAYPHFQLALGTYSVSPTHQFNSTDTVSGFQGTFTWFGWYKMLFVGLRGSMRYKIISSTGQGLVTAWAGTQQDWSLLGANLPFATNPQFIASGNAVVGNTASGNGVEFVVPYYDSGKFFPSRYAYAINPTTPNPYARFDVIAIAANNDLSTNIPRYNSWIYAAGGPDIALIRFRRVPALKVWVQG